MSDLILQKVKIYIKELSELTNLLIQKNLDNKLIPDLRNLIFDYLNIDDTLKGYQIRRSEPYENIYFGYNLNNIIIAKNKYEGILKINKIMLQQTAEYSQKEYEVDYIKDRLYIAENNFYDSSAHAVDPNNPEDLNLLTEILVADLFDSKGNAYMNSLYIKEFPLIFI